MSIGVIQLRILFFFVVTQCLIVQELGNMELHPMAAVNQRSIIVEFIQCIGHSVIADHRCGQDLCIIFLHVRIRDRCTRSALFPGLAGCIHRILLVRQIHCTAGIRLHKSILVSHTVVIRALQLAKEHLTAVGRHLAAVFNKCPATIRWRCRPAVHCDRSAIHLILAAKPAVGADLGRGNVHVRGVIYRQLCRCLAVVSRRRLTKVHHKVLPVGQFVIIICQRRCPSAGIAFFYSIGDPVALCIEYRGADRSQTVCISLCGAGLGFAVIDFHHEAGFFQIRAEKSLLYFYRGLVLNIIECECVKAGSISLLRNVLLYEGHRSRSSLNQSTHIDVVGSIQRVIVLHDLFRKTGIQVVACRKLSFMEIIGSCRQIYTAILSVCRDNILPITSSRIRNVYIALLCINCKLRFCCCIVKVAITRKRFLMNINSGNRFIIDSVCLIFC